MYLKTTWEDTINVRHSYRPDKLLNCKLDFNKRQYESDWLYKLFLIM